MNNILFKILMLKGDAGNPTDEQTQAAVDEYMQAHPEAAIDETIINSAVDDWLDDHPDATTSVLDGSLTLPKFKAGELPFVTPELYGAKGDGITDDTVAWQAAVDSGFDVKATKKSYKCGQINITKNITVDCGGADFICTASKLFYCSGEVVATINSAPDYTANQSYSITDETYANYTGFAMLRGSNNFETSRSYYKGGFACEFRNGKLVNPYPVDVEDTSIDIINPIKVIFENIGKISHTLATDISISSLHFEYGFGCTVKNSNFKDSNGYYILKFEKCMNCVVDNCRVNRDLTTPDSNQSYPVGWLDSSFCVARDCYFVNAKWHCITTGNIYLCYHNVVDNCELYSMEQYAYCDHQNAANTIVKNTISSCISVAAMGHVENCIIVPALGSPYKRCWLNMIPPSNVNTAIFTVRDIKIMSASDANGNYVGVGFEHSAQISGGTYYVKTATIDNVKCYGLSSGGRINLGFESTSNYILYDVFVNNVNLNIYLAKTATQTNIDISNYILNLSNIIEKAVTNLPWLGYTTMIFNDVNCENCNFARIYGSFHDLTLRNVYAANAIDEDAKVSNRFVGYGIRCRIASLAFQLPAYVNITDFVWNDGEYRYNVFKNGSSSTTYGWRWNGGALQALTILSS